MISTFKLKRGIWWWALRQMRNIVWRADEWIHEQELQFRTPTAVLRPPDEFDPTASRKRERIYRNKAGARRPVRLRYSQGEWIQTESKI